MLAFRAERILANKGDNSMVRQMGLGAAAAILAGAIAGCATQPMELGTVYVTPVFYKEYTCELLARETTRMNHKLSRLHGHLKASSDGDNWQLPVGMLLMPPVLLALEGGDGPAAAEYALAKGEAEAAHKAANMKNCSL